MPFFNESVIKNDPVKKKREKPTLVFAFIEGVHLSHSHVLVIKDRTFHNKLLSSLYPKSTLLSLIQFWATKISLKVMKNTFYIILKALLVLKILKSLSWLCTKCLD